jgi:hypothetical protein
MTQWRVGMAGATGLDYPAMYLVADSLGIEVTRANLNKVQALERAVLVNRGD